MVAEVPEKTRGQKAWDFLNSPFALWFLTSIAVGLLTWSYSEWQAVRTHEQENRQQLKQLRLELSARTAAARSLFATASTNYQLYEVAKVMDNPQLEGIDFGAFPEYGERPMRSLLLQLEGLYEKGREREDVLDAIKAHSDIIAAGREFWEACISSPRGEPSVEKRKNLRDRVELLYRAMLYERE